MRYASAPKDSSELMEHAKPAPRVPTLTLIYRSAGFHAQQMKSSKSSIKPAIALLKPSESKESVPNALETQLTALKLECADVLRATGTKEDTVWSDVDRIKSFRTDNAAVLLGSTR